MQMNFINKSDEYYYKNLKEILDNGFYDENPRPKYSDGTPAFSKFIIGVFETYDLQEHEFPIPTFRNTAIKMGIKEIQWIYQLQSNELSELRNLGIYWWDNWDIGNGTIGNRYGYTVKKYNLINNLLSGLKKDPFSRRHIMNLLQEEDLNSSSGLYPCAFETQWSVRRKGNDYLLDCTLIQRSNDYLVAGYINKIQYVALQMMICSHLGYLPGKFNHYVQNLHIYDRHISAAKEILNYAENNYNPNIDKPFLSITKDKNFFDITVDDFNIPKMETFKLSKKLELAI